MYFSRYRNNDDKRNTANKGFSTVCEGPGTAGALNPTLVPQKIFGSGKQTAKRFLS